MFDSHFELPNAELWVTLAFFGRRSWGGSTAPHYALLQGVEFEVFEKATQGFNCRVRLSCLRGFSNLRPARFLGGNDLCPRLAWSGHSFPCWCVFFPLIPMCSTKSTAKNAMPFRSERMILGSSLSNLFGTEPPRAEFDAIHRWRPKTGLRSCRI
jgi:hypothetical protein